MGQATDAILFYGYHFPEDYELPEEAVELWEGDVLVGTHCSSDYPMYYVYVAESRTVAYRGYAKAVRPSGMADAHPAWEERLLSFAQERGVPLPETPVEYTDGVSKIGWWLVSDWG